MIIRLTPQQLHAAWSVGMKRHLVSMSHGLKQRFSAESNDNAKRLYNDVVAAAGEMAAGMALSAFWMATVGPQKEPDLLPSWQVRTAQNHNHRLYVGEDDDDLDKFVLVTTESPLEFHVRGWILASEAKAEEWGAVTNSGVRCWMVPARALRRLSERD